MEATERRISVASVTPVRAIGRRAYDLVTVMVTVAVGFTLVV